MIGLARVAGVLAAISVTIGAWSLGPSPRIGYPQRPGESQSASHQSAQSTLKFERGKPETKPNANRPKTPDCSKLKCVALTMDDGPIPQTAEVLALLKKKGVRATFFVLGENAARHPELLHQMAADGHVVANHSWSHPQFFRMSRKGIVSQLSRTDSLIQKATGKRPTLIRTPYGQVDSRVRSIAKTRGQTLVLWDVDPVDWKDRKAKTVLRRVLAQTGRGSIILTHDIWPSSRRAYGRIIDRLRAKGYTFVTVPELLGSKAKPGKVFLHG